MSADASPYLGASESRNGLLPIDIRSLVRVGEGLVRPETTLGMRSGEIYSSVEDAAVVRVDVSGQITRIGEAISGNGIAMDKAGKILVANFSLGTTEGGPLQRLDPATGSVEDVVSEIGGRKLVASNFVVIARDGSAYCTHSSWGPTMDACIDPDNDDGFVYRLSSSGEVDIVATGLAGANGCCLDADELYLYVAQTGRGNIVRFKRYADGSLGPAERYGPSLGLIPKSASVGELFQMNTDERSQLGHPDNIAFDARGNLWVALVVANRVVAITPSGDLVTMVDDPEGLTMVMPTSIAWGGPDLTDVYIGSLGASYVLRGKSPVPGMPLLHQALPSK